MAFLVPIIASASTATLVSTGIALATAYVQVKQGEETKKAYYSQAEYKRLEGRIEAVKAKEQGIKALENTRRALASVNASARAGGGTFLWEPSTCAGSTLPPSSCSPQASTLSSSPTFSPLMLG